MKKMYTPQSCALLFCFLLSLFSFNGFSQVGIGTTNPNPNALLDLDASTTSGGLLLPRVSLAATNSFAPLTANVAGMVVYNTSTGGIAPNNVTPGYYYNDGTGWVRVAADSVASDDWTTNGNVGTDPNTNFVGTTDNEPLRFRTRSIERFEITDGNNNNNNGGGRLRAFFNGTAGSPVYSWQNNIATGMFQQAANVIGFSTNGTERFRIPNASQVHAMSTGTAALPFYSWAGDSNTGILNPVGDNLGFSTGGNERFRIPNANQVHAMTDGSEVLPFYSWGADINTGMYRIAGNTLGFSTNAIERLRLSAAEAVFNDTSNDYDFRIESDGQANMFFVDASTNRIGIQTATPAYSFHMLNSGAVGATAMAAFVNTGTDGVALSARNSGINSYNTIEGITDYNAAAYSPAGVYGLGIASSGTSTGVRGISNSSNGFGVFGSIPTAGTWNGYGGVFIGGLGYANGVYNLSDERAKKNITKISSALDNIMKINGVSYNYDMKKFNPNASEDPHTYYGFLAQNIKEYLPFAVAEKNVPFDDFVKDINSSSTDHSQLLNVVDYTAIVPVLVEAMKEQQAQIKALQEKLKTLEAKN